MKAVLKWLAWALFTLLGLVVVAAPSFYFWLRGSLPEINGERTLTGLVEPVEVVRDEFGVPHIMAENEEDALFALGFVHAQDRLWQMEMNRRIGAGRLSEVLGSPALETDRLLRVLGLYHRAEASLEHFSAPSNRKLAAYVHGVNAWLETREGPLPPEFLILGFEPEPWSAADSAVWPKVMSLDLAREWTRDQMRFRLSKLLTPEQILDFYTPYQSDKPRGVVPEVSDSSSVPLWESDESTPEKSSIAWFAPDYPGTELSDMPSFEDFISQMLSALPPPGGHSGSNSWVVDGRRSSTGKPLLANDPHLGLTAPSVWYLVHLSWPGHELVGATFPGMPVVVLGHNGHIAWGFTNTGPDVQDLFMEKIDPSDRLRYQTPNGWRKFEVRRERIRVKNSEDVLLDVRHSRYGPILDDALAGPSDDDDAGQVFALSWTALRDDDLTLQAGLGLPKTRDWESFVSNMRDFHSPQLNISYADVHGNIGFLAPGLVPIRREKSEHHRGMMPRPGWEEGFEWQGFVPFEELPRVYNPAGGVIFSANHQIVSDDYPHHITFEWAGGYRAQRIMEWLELREKHDLESFRDLQQDRLSFFAKTILPRLRRVDIGKDATQLTSDAHELLHGWEGTMDPLRPEPLIFHAWIWEFGRLVSADELGSFQQKAWRRQGPFIQRILQERESWCDDRESEAIETCEQMLSRSLAVAMERIARDHGTDPKAWSWGKEHIVVSEHRPFGNTPLAPLFNLSGSAPGSIYSVNAFGFSPLQDEQPFTSNHGPGFRAIYDLGNLDRSLFILSTGQSGNVLTSLYHNLEKLWLKGEYITIPTDRAEFEKNARGHLRLVPP